MALTCGLAGLSSFMLVFCCLNCMWSSIVCATLEDAGTKVDPRTGEPYQALESKLGSNAIGGVACFVSCCLAVTAAVVTMRKC
jgi:hypothetical protein